MLFPEDRAAYQDRLDHDPAFYPHDIRHLLACIDQDQARIAALEAALEFYASPMSYGTSRVREGETSAHQVGTRLGPNVMRDGGQFARTALGKSVGG